MDDKQRILCIGEVLWDALPEGLFLGGAPLNVTYHLHQLGEKAGMISRVGNDRLGSEAVRRIRQKGLSVDLIQQDEEYETGFVEVELDDQGDPAYQIVEPVAWDYIKLTGAIREKIDEAWALVFGSLAMRNAASRSTINQLLEMDIRRVFDINLRTPFYSRELISDALNNADILKLNIEELKQLIQWFNLTKVPKQAVTEIADHFGCGTIAVTKGSEGSMLYHQKKWAEHDGFVVEVKDAVGSGDAFLAALLRGLQKNGDIEEVLEFANATGAYVASQAGAMPDYKPGNLSSLKRKRQQSE